MKTHNKTNIIIATTIFGVASFALANQTSAITYQNATDQEFTFNPTISVSLSSSDLQINDLAPGGVSDSNEITATVATNAGYGYYLSATAGSTGGNTNLTNTADSTYNFTSLSSNVANLNSIPDNNWGYTYSTDNGSTWISGDNGSATTGYNGLPLDANDNGATGIKLLSSNEFATSGSVKFKIAAKASTSQAAGTYTNTINFYAVTNPAPVTFDDAYSAAGKTKQNGYYTLQDATPAICTAVTQGQTTSVIDTRDDTVYHIGKFNDNRCWLLDNLALNLNNHSVVNALSSANTNASDATLNYMKNGGGTTSDRYAINGLTYSDWVNEATNVTPLINTSNINTTVTKPEGAGVGDYKVGIHYNYCAASAGSYCFGGENSPANPGSPSGDATEDICPKKWSLPSKDDYIAYGTTYGNQTGRLPLSLPQSGRVMPATSSSGSGSIDFIDQTGDWWTSTLKDNSNMKTVNVGTNGWLSYSEPYDYRVRGLTIRCILKTN